MPPLTRPYRSQERPSRAPRGAVVPRAQSPEEARLFAAEKVRELREVIARDLHRAQATCPECKSLVVVERRRLSEKYSSLHWCAAQLGYRTSAYLPTREEAVAAVVAGDFWGPPSELAQALVERDIRIFLWPRERKRDREMQQLRQRLIGEQNTEAAA